MKNYSYDSSSHTFVVSAYGESEYLEECVESIVVQDVPTNLLIATSTPNETIRRVADKFNVPLYINRNKPGIASDWNFAVSCTDTPLVTIAHQDDIYSKDYSKHMLDSMNTAVQTPLLFFCNYAELRNGNTVEDNSILRVKRFLLTPLKSNFLRSQKLIKRGCLSLGSPICCPSVTYNREALPNPIFSSPMKCDLDWDSWEQFSHLNGEFIYSPAILMCHRIHQDSETSALIEDNTRSFEDLEMLKRFWPNPIAKIINHFYSKSQASNSI